MAKLEGGREREKRVGLCKKKKFGSEEVCGWWRWEEHAEGLWRGRDFGWREGYSLLPWQVILFI